MVSGSSDGVAKLPCALILEDSSKSIAGESSKSRANRATITNTANVRRVRPALVAGSCAPPLRTSRVRPAPRACSAVAIPTTTAHKITVGRLTQANMISSTSRRASRIRRLVCAATASRSTAAESTLGEGGIARTGSTRNSAIALLQNSSSMCAAAHR